MLTYRNRFILALNRPGVIHDPCQFYDCADCGDPFKPGDCESTRYCQGCLEQVVNEENEMSEKVKPCPFCGGTDIRIRVLVENNSLTVAWECQTCVCRGPRTTKEDNVSMELAARQSKAKWNERYPNDK